MRWQFLLDVGGKFHDCLQRRPDGQLLRRKVLSSAVMKGIVATGSTSDGIVDPARTEVDGFWTGYQLRLLDGTLNRVVGFDGKAGRLIISGIPKRIEGLSYE